MKEYKVVRQAVVIQEAFVCAVDEQDAIYRAESLESYHWDTLTDTSAKIDGTLTSEEVEE